MEIVRCVSCDGYGWLPDEDAPDQAQDCAWCGGVGYVYRGTDGIDRPIPAADLPRIAQPLEALEHQRLREMGYSGEAKHPSQQAVRKSPKPPAEENQRWASGNCHSECAPFRG